MVRVSPFLIVLVLGAGAARAQTTWTVCASGCDFTTIGAAVSAAGSGDTIQVSSGTYAESVLVGASLTSLTIAGAGPDQTTLEVDGSSGIGFSVLASSVAVSGFRILGSGGTEGVRLGDVDSCEISGNRIEGLPTGIQLAKSDSNEIRENELVDYGQGISLTGSASPADGADSNLIEGNTFLEASGGGTAILVAAPSTGNEIRDNVALGVTGLSYWSSASGNTLVNNLFESLSIAVLTTTSPNTWNDPKSSGTNIVGGPFLGGNAYLDGAYFAYNCEDGDGDQLCDSSYSHGSNNVDALPLRMALGPADELDWGDAPGPYPTLQADKGAAHFNLVSGPYLGSSVDIDPDGQPSSGATGDDSDLDGDDEDGVVLAPLVPGVESRMHVTSSAPANLRAWIDFDANGVWDNPGERIVEAPVAAGANVLPFQVPASALVGTTYARFRLCSWCLPGPAGIAADGEVEDHQVDVEQPPLDWGDAPDPPYPTLAVSGGPAHVVGGGLYLGAAVDAEPVPMPSPTAEGDDGNGIDDEDSAVLVSDMVAGYTSELDISASSAGVFQGWVDFNIDGDWTDPGEQAINQAISGGLNTISFAVPATASAGATFARLRISWGGGLTPNGVAADGEVEDYLAEVFDSMPEHLLVENETIDVRRIFRALETITATSSEVQATATFCAGARIALGTGFSVGDGTALVVRLADPQDC